MKTVHNLSAMAAALLAGPAFAELNERQQSAYDMILPALEESVVEQGGEELRPMAALLAECVALNAKRRELKGFGDGEIDEDDTATLNDIMARPKVQGCVAEAVASS